VRKFYPLAAFTNHLNWKKPGNGANFTVNKQILRIPVFKIPYHEPNARPI
jgi:hypothetical protein